VGPCGRGKSGKWHHGAAGVAHIELLQVVRVHAVPGVRLRVHLLDAAVGIEKVVDIARAPGNREGLIDVGYADAEGGGFLAIDIDLERRVVLLPAEAHLCESRVLFCQSEELVPRLGERVMAEPAAILELEVETGSGAQAPDRGWADRSNDGLLVRGE